MSAGPAPPPAQPLNVLFVGILPPQRGGGGISCGELVAGLARLGHRVRALAPIPEEALRAGDAFAAAHPEVEVRRFVVPPYTIDPTLLPPDDYREREHRQIQQMLPEMMTAERPDVILIGRGAFVLDVPEVAQAYSVPTVLRSAGATSIGILNRLLPDALGEQLLRQYHKLDLIICPAAHLAERLRAAGLPNVRVISNAVDPRKFTPQPRDTRLGRRLGIPPDHVVVLHASNLKPLKRPLDLVVGADLALIENPGLTFVIVGDGPLRAAMEEACRDRGIAGHFQFVGWVDYDEVSTYINLADIVVMPSEGEGLARVYLETMACGRVLLASDIPAAREAVTDGVTGVLFRKGDVGDLTAKLLWLAARPALRGEIGRGAYAASRAMSLDRTVAAYAAALQEVTR